MLERLLLNAYSMIDHYVRSSLPFEHENQILFFTLSHGNNQGLTISVMAKDFESCWDMGLKKIDKLFLNPLNENIKLRVDLVKSIKKYSWKEWVLLLHKTRRNYFYSGVCLDQSFENPILPAEISAHNLLYCEEKFHCVPNQLKLSEWSKNKFGYEMRWPTHEQDIIWGFDTQGFYFESEDSLILQSQVGQPAIREIKDGWQQELLPTLIQHSRDYLVKQNLPSGKFIYGRYAVDHSEIKNYNILRHTKVIESLIDSLEIEKDIDTRKTVDNAIHYLLKNRVVKKTIDNKIATFIVDQGGEVKLGGCAAALLMLIKYQAVTCSIKYLSIMTELAEGIIFMQDGTSGRFNHIFNGDDLSIKQSSRVVFYDAAATYALIRLYRVTLDPRILSTVVNAVNYFILNEHWQHHDPALSYTINELVNYYPDDKYFNLALKNISSRIDFCLTRKTSYPSLVELIIESKKIVEKIISENKNYLLINFELKKLNEAFLYRSKYIINFFFWPEFLIFFKEQKEIAGSFYNAYENYRVRVDDVSEHLSALLAIRREVLAKQNVFSINPQNQSNQVTTVFLLPTIRNLGNGIEVSSLRRAQLFTEKLDCRPYLITYIYNPDLYSICSKLKSEAVIPKDCPVINLYYSLNDLYARNIIDVLPKNNEILEVSKFIDVNFLRPLGKKSYVMENGNEIVEDFFNIRGEVLLRRYFKKKNSVLELELLQVYIKNKGIENFKDEGEFSAWCLEAILERNRKWNIVVDKNRSYRKFLLSRPKNRINCTITSIIHSTHLHPSGRYKISYQHFLQDHTLVDNVIVLTQEQYHDLVEQGYPQNKIKVIPHHIDPQKFTPRIPRPSSQNVVYLARYSIEKQHFLLINAFKKVIEKIPNAKLYTYGAGPLKAELIELVENLSLSDSIKIGDFTNDIAEVHQQSCCSVLCSNHEGFSLSAIESMAFGTPLVSFAIKYGPKDILENQNAGLLIPEGDESALVEALIKIVSDNEIQISYQQGAVKCAERFYSDNISILWASWKFNIESKLININQPYEVV